MLHGAGARYRLVGSFDAEEEQRAGGSSVLPVPAGSLTGRGRAARNLAVAGAAEKDPVTVSAVVWRVDDPDTNE